MSLVAPTDGDFRLCEVTLDELAGLQVDAELRGFATRWTSVHALRSQVDDRPVVLMTLLRETRGEDVRAFRCLLRCHPVEASADSAAVAATIDVAPDRLQELPSTEGDHARLIADFPTLTVLPKH